MGSNQHQEGQKKKAKTRIIELEEELKFTRDGYEEEIKTLLEKNGDLVKKIEVFMGGPAPIEEEEEPKEIRPEDYIIIDDTDSDPDSSDEDYEDEAGADIMESSTDQNFLSTTILLVVFPHVYRIVRALLYWQLDRLYALA